MNVMLNALQIEHLLARVGCPSHLKVTLTAIALAESQGGARPYGDCYGTVGCTSFGLWQVHTRNMLDEAVNVQPSGHPYNEHRLVVDPVYNAHAALNVYRSQGLNAWSTYDYGHGAYLAFLPQARAAARHDEHVVRHHRHHAVKRPRSAAVIVHKHHPPQHPVHHHAIGTQAAMSNLAISFVAAAGLLMCWNMFRLGCRLVTESIREEIAARKRYSRRQRYRENEALRRRTMPRRRVALAANAY